LAASLFAAVALVSTGLAQAALFDRGNGLIYDSALNVTWLQDVGYAETSGYDSDGLFNWDDARTWVNQLDYNGIKGWRLPNIKPVNGVAFNHNFSTDGSTDYGYNISYPGRTNPFDAASVSAGFTGNELAYMFYVELGNLATFKVDGTHRTGTYKVDFGLVNTSFVDATSRQTETFKNLSHVGVVSLWTSSPGNSIYTFSFNASGFSDNNNKDQLFGAWAVHEGDVAAQESPPGLLPEPAMLALLSLAFAGIGLTRQRKLN
jgi:hypothetical protein